MAMQDITHYMRAGTLSLTSLPPLSLYIHLPWCLKKCPYCDFNSHEVSNRTSLIKVHSSLQSASSSPNLNPDLSSTTPTQHLHLPIALEQQYIAALIADLQSALPLIWGRPVQSIFIGGGTPSLFSPESIESLLSQIRSLLPLVAECEITLEANPGTFEKDRFRAFKNAGVTRLSVGVQSFNDAHLQALGRVHSAEQAHLALQEAAATFKTYNLDLMYALPQQTIEQLEADLQTALSFEPPHLSIYQLTLEPNTVFAKYPPVVPDEDTAYSMLDLIEERTASHELKRYEISAFSRKGHQCWHNVNYWQFGDYLGIGAGAHGKISFAHRIIRQNKTRDPLLYIEKALAGNAIAQESEIKRADLPFEFMLNGLRLIEGVSVGQFLERTGLPISSIQKGLAQGIQKGLLIDDLHQIKATPHGINFLNDLQQLFL